MSTQTLLGAVLGNIVNVLAKDSSTLCSNLKGKEISEKQK